MTKKTVIAAAIGVAAVLATPAALAQQLGWYAGGSVGQMEADGDCPPGVTCDLEDTSFKFFGGYRINRNFAAEAFWGEWGEISLTAGPFTGTVKVRTIGIAGLGILPIGQQFELFGKLGFGNTSQRFTGTAPGMVLTDTDTGSELVYGFGAAFNFTRNFGVRTEWERLNDSEVDIMSIGLQYRF